MYVGVIHKITDAAAWDRGLEAFATTELPETMRNPITYVGTDKEYAFCLWDVPSVDALQSTLDGLTAGAAVNTYFAIDPGAVGTSGIPEQRVDLTTKATAATGR
jgi:hypothetical protein